MAKIYIARSSEPILCKKWVAADDGRIEQADRSPGNTFKYECLTASSLRDVFRVLTRLTDDRHCAMVMGEPLFEHGERKLDTFTELSRYFWFIDLDGVPLVGTVRETIERCLPFLCGYAYVYSFSQSAGIRQGALRVRVVVHLDREMTGHEFEAQARHYNDLLVAFEGGSKKYIDSGIYGRERLLYTARPEFVGCADPHTERVFYVDGAPVVTLPDLPDMVELVVGTGAVAESGLPRLRGTWGAGDGFNRSYNAYHGICRLKRYMGEEDWADEIRRDLLWHKMIKTAGGGEDDIRKYGRYVSRWAHKAVIRDEAERTVLVHANHDNSIQLDAAARQLDNVIRETVISMQQAKTTAIKVTMGTGKTHLMMKHLAAQHRFYEDLGLGAVTCDWYVPTHAMAAELGQMAEDNSVPYMIEEGRGRPGMCEKKDSAKKIQGLVDNVVEHLCKDSNGNLCPYIGDCKWQKQRRESQFVTLRIRVHDYLPLTVRGEDHEHYRHINFVVIDETSWVFDMLHNRWIELADLLEPRHDEYDWVLKFAAVVNDGLTLDRLEAAGFTPDVFRALIKAEESLKPKLPVTPNMTNQQTWKILEGYDDKWHLYASMWRRMRDCLESRSLNRVRVVKDKKKKRTAFVLNWRSDIAAIPMKEGVPTVPVVVMSGTMQRDQIEQFLPIDDYHEIDVAPHPESVITQSTMRGTMAECLYGSSDIRIEAGEDDKDKIAKAAAVREKVGEIAEDKVLITYKALEELLDRVAPTAHFNNIEGLNEFSGLDLVVYGRTLPGPHSVEDLTRALHQDDPNPIGEIKGTWYPSRRVARRGEGFTSGEYHPDPRVESIRWSVCEGEIMQALARSRYVREPVNVLLLGRTPLPIHVDRVVSDKRLDPEWQAFEETKFMPLSQNEYLRLWPTIWTDGRSAYRWAVENKDTWRDDHAALEIEYRVKGQRGPPKKALVDGMDGIRGVGAVDVEVRDSDHNDWAVCQRELFDMMAREPRVLEDGYDKKLSKPGKRHPAVWHGDTIAVETRKVDEDGHMVKARIVRKQGRLGVYEWTR